MSWYARNARENTERAVKVKQFGKILSVGFLVLKETRTYIIFVSFRHIEVLITC